MLELEAGSALVGAEMAHLLWGSANEASNTMRTTIYVEQRPGSRVTLALTSVFGGGVLKGGKTPDKAGAVASCVLGTGKVNGEASLRGNGRGRAHGINMGNWLFCISFSTHIVLVAASRLVRVANRSLRRAISSTADFPGGNDGGDARSRSVPLSQLVFPGTMPSFARAPSCCGTLSLAACLPRGGALACAVVMAGFGDFRAASSSLDIVCPRWRDARG
jgi:hypothetical protein